jgi:hypothetical protein
MSHITLTEEQSKQIYRMAGPVEVRDARGNVVTVVEIEDSPAVIAELKRRAREPGPRYTTQQVVGQLEALEKEWERTGGFDEARMLEFLERLRKAESAG